MSIMDDVAELLDPSGIDYKLMTGRDGAAAPKYPVSPSGTLAPAYVERLAHRFTGPQGDEIQAAGKVYAPCDPLLTTTAFVLLPEGPRKVVGVDSYQDNDDQAGLQAAQVIHFQ